MHSFFSRLLYLTFFIVSFQYASGQQILKPVKPEVARQVRDRKIIVMLYEEDASVLKGLDVAKQKTYKDRVSNLNAGLRVIKDLWSFNKSVECMMPSEIRKLPNLATDYAIISIAILKINAGAIVGYNNFLARMFIAFPDDLDPKHPIFYEEIYTTTTDHDVPSTDRIGIIAGMYRLQEHLKARADDKKRIAGLYQEDAVENHGMLEGKTLLLNKEYLDKDLTDADIKESYNYNFEICDNAKILKALTTKDSHYAFAYRFPFISKYEQYNHVIFETSTGKIISYSMTWGSNRNDFIDKNHLKNYWLFSDYYVNKAKAKSKK